MKLQPPQDFGFVPSVCSVLLFCTSLCLLSRVLGLDIVRLVSAKYFVL